MHSFFMVSDSIMWPLINVSDFSTEDTRNELLSSATVEFFVKKVALINEAWTQYVF